LNFELSDGGGSGVGLFSLRGVRQERGGTEVLHGIDLDIPAGQITALVGPSGSGKTSLLRLLNRLDDPSAGEVSFDGKPIAGYPVRALRHRVGFVFQAPVMFPGSVAENLRIAAGLAGRAAGVEAEIERLLPLVGLDVGYAARDGERLSGGERQRVNIARALITRPQALLLDEPTSALDPEVADRLMGTVRDLSAEVGLTTVMVTHRLAEARDASGYTVMLEAGKVVETGPTAELFARPREPRTRAYLAAGGVSP
jgi:ABC-type methionine transport system ATPase subunit